MYFTCLIRAEAKSHFADMTAPILLGITQIPEDLFEAMEELSVLCVVLLPVP